MLIIDRYISKTVILAILLIVCMLTGLQIFILFVNELGDIGKGDYGVLQALIFVLLSMPYQVYLFFPMASLLGCLIGLGIMASHNELVVMRASCMSISRITLVVLRVSILLILIMTILGEIVFPKLVLNASDKKLQAISAGHSLRTDKGIWLRNKNDFINISKVSSNNNFENVVQFHFDEKHDLRFVRHIDHVDYEHNTWQAYGILETDVNENSTKTLKKDKLPWDVNINPRMLSLSAVDPPEMTFIQLYNFIHAQKSSYYSMRSYELAFWQRLVQPLTTMVMMMLAIPFVFGPLRSSTMGSKLLIGATMGFGFYIINRFFGSLSHIYQFSSFIAAIGPTAFFALFGMYLMRMMR